MHYAICQLNFQIFNELKQLHDKIPNQLYTNLHAQFAYMLQAQQFGLVRLLNLEKLNIVGVFKG